MSTRSYAALLAALGAAAVCVEAPAAWAEARAKATFDIPAGELAAALDLFSHQASVQIFYPADAVAGRRNVAVKGVMAPRAALERLLTESGLEVAEDDGRTISLRRTDHAAATAVQEIVVTAQKRAQKSIDVPLALTAYTGADMTKLGITNFRELSAHVPGLLVEDQSPNNPIFVIRGITSSGGDSFTEPRVSVFENGASISKSRGSYVELFDDERVEVAKGPQSTLFGRGALIGAINIVENKAGPNFDWSAAAEGGTHGYRQFDAMVNMPLTDGVSLRLAMRNKVRDGYQDNLAPGAKDGLNSVDTQAYRAVLSLRPDGRFSSDVIINWQGDDTDGTGFKAMNEVVTDPTTGKVLAGPGLSAPAALSKPANFEPGHGLGVHQQVFGATVLNRLSLSHGLTLNSITSFRDVYAREVYDADGTSLPIFTNGEKVTSNQIGQEFRLNYDNGGRISWFAGANYYHESARTRVDTQFDERMLLAQVTGFLNGGIPGRPKNEPAPLSAFDNTAFTGALLQGLIAQDSKGALTLSTAQAQALAAQLDPSHQEGLRDVSNLNAYDMFGDVTFHVTDKLELSGGLRYSEDYKRTGWSSFVTGRSILGGAIGAAGVAAAGTPAAIATGNALIQGLTAYGHTLNGPLPLFAISDQPTANNGDMTSRNLADDGLSWRLTAKYAFTPSVNGYASYSRGRRPAVLSAAAPGAPGGAPTFTVAPDETATSYEVGLKSALLHRRLRIDVSVYDFDYDNFQTSEQVGSTFVTTNAGRAQAYGLETQVNFVVTPWADLFGTYAYNHARFTSGAYKGNHFSRSPDNTVSIGGSIRREALGGVFDFRPIYTYRSLIFFADDNGRADLERGLLVPGIGHDDLQKGFGLLNLRLSYAPTGGRWAVEAFATNATDVVYRKGAGSAGQNIGLPTEVLGEPREIGLRFSIHH